MHKNIRVLLACLLLLSSHAFAQKQSPIRMYDFETAWKKVDSLNEKLKPESAKKEVAEILKKATGLNDEPQIIKAKTWLLALNKYQENAELNTIKAIESEIAKAKNNTEKAIWYNLTAKQYQSYLDNNRYQLYSRTQLAETTSDDISTWDINAFHQKIGQLYQASILNRNALLQIPTSDYSAIINKGKNTAKLRPSLYDVLVFDAIAYFSENDRYITQPAYAFKIDEEQYFAPAAVFVHLKINSKDSNALHIQALKLYQELIAVHLNDKNTEALIDADLLRLSFAKENSTLKNKEQLYTAAMEQLKQQYPNSPSVAQIKYLLAQSSYSNNQSTNMGRGKRGAVQPTKKTDLRALQTTLEGIAKQYPNTEGGINAQNLLNTLGQRTIKIDIEAVNIPNENIRALISYKNVKGIELSLFKISTTAFINKETQLSQPVRVWQQNLINSEDLNDHSTEIKIDAVAAGQYALVIKDKDNIVSPLYQYFQVSELSAVKYQHYGANSERTKGAYIINRKTGFMIPGTSLAYKKEDIKGNKWTALGSGDKDGVINANIGRNQIDYNTMLLLHKGKDSLLMRYAENYGFIDYESNTNYKSMEQTHAFVFTDRSIYRPGQTIYFKGIVIRTNKEQTQNNVVKNEKVSITFKDVNAQTIKEVSFTTNDFGSFTGSFTAPESGLTGQMQLTTPYGGAWISVEEYKRPKFFVSYDTLKNNYALNDQITIKGTAKAYAGNTIGAAQVKYRVVRNTRFPYWWLSYRWGIPMNTNEQEMANGTTETDANGNFSVSFKALPDETINPEALPVFQYEITTDITDINGETRSNNTNLSVGYSSLVISAITPEQAIATSFKKLNIRTENLNGIFTPTTVAVKIKQLQAADRLYRNRLWEVPSDFVLSEEAFKQAFPNDEYKEEWKPENRKALATVWEQSYTTKEDDALTLDEKIWSKTGYYEIEISGKDKNGKPVQEKKYVFVLVPAAPVQYDIALFTAQKATSYQPNETMELWVSPAYHKANLFQKNTWQKTYDWQQNNLVKQAITEADRGGATLNWMYVYNNRIYQTTNQVMIPWSNKDLNLTWATHRDKLEPNAKEEWTITIAGDKKEKVAAELVAGLYDASLDALQPHNWNWESLYRNRNEYYNWQGFTFNTSSGQEQGKDKPWINYEKVYPNFSTLGIDPDGEYYDLLTNEMPRRGSGPKNFYTTKIDKRTYTGSLASIERSADVQAAPGVAASSEARSPKNKSVAQQEESSTKEPKTPSVSPRTNLKETAFFIPQVRTDDKGNVVLKFTMPEALTEWKLMAFAHTQDWKTGYLSGSIKTQKELMVTPNMPRFFRQGDDMTIAAKISNLSSKALNGTASIEILNAQTLQPLNLPFGFRTNEQKFSVAPNQSTNTNFSIKVPQAIYEPVIVRIVASAGNFSDGEEHTIPVITNRTLVTETLPLPVKGNQTATFTFDKLLQSGQSKSLLNKGLTVEYTGNPAWYAVQALPYLMDYPYECAEQTFNRFYANALAAHIVAQSPKVAAIFNSWKNEDSAALLSNLEKNQELKTALLEETPWVLEAKDEQTQKKNIARLFETHQMVKSLKQSLQKLEKMQKDNGAFPWFEGMYDNRYITQYVLTGLAKLKHLNVAAATNSTVDNMIKKGLVYLDKEIQKDYKAINTTQLKEHNLGQLQIQYLYLRSFLNPQIAVAPDSRTAFDYYINQSKQFWAKHNNYMQGMIALSLFRIKEVSAAKTITASLSERAIQNKEMGMYWKNTPGYWWYEAPVETQSLLIGVYKEILNDTKSVDEMKIWLLKQKQTQHWTTTTATADACYALLESGTDWLQYTPSVTIQLGDKTIVSDQVKTQAGTGYFKQYIAGEEVKPNMGNISVTVDNKTGQNTGTSWGAAYWQYFEDLDKISGAQNDVPLHIEKQLFIERNTDNGPSLTAIKEGNSLKIGDKVKVRIILKVDRTMDYVHMKDMRAAGFEPVNVLSGYRYQGGLGYYEATKDVATHFFFDHLPKGTYVFEYPVMVNQKGNFSNGITTAQCMYAPEFSSHSEGIRVEVK
ncbi:alpha-2-macroglobulin [Taibaiella sp. KBW10]|uniref:alpha-2-macroglobulin family protein n=1 Tax=Taibaiella sp. KBW10 TaxID=2153357 RepID=UPI000F5B834D|nr:alpha-2-macroglobulin family protein [Taibaiella sp. KBW10]RQO32201.1 alpha-2-macroglobulin [Taibaiella sp. KBW10]